MLTRDEVSALLQQLHGVEWLIGTLLYGTGLRVSECLDLRVKAVDFGAQQIVVRDGKGGTDRVTMLPAMVSEPLARHLEWVRRQHDRDTLWVRAAFRGQRVNPTSAARFRGVLSRSRPGACAGSILV